MLDGKASQWERLHAGVPQGSVLGPLLFLIFINDLVDTLDTDPHLFADDRSLLDIYFDPQLSCLKIRKISDWGKVRKVTFNPSKTKFIVFSHHQSYSEYPYVVFNGVNVERTIEHVHLGLTITSNLSWRKHIFTVINKASRAIHILNFVKHRLPRSGLSSLYKTMILPILEYCDIMYDNCTVRESAILEQVQRRAALVCTGAYKHTRTDLLLAELGWLPLKERRDNHKLCTLLKMSRGLTPPYLTAVLPIQRDTGYNLRKTGDGSMPIIRCRLSCARYSFLFFTMLWNAMNYAVALVLNILSWISKKQHLRTTPFFHIYTLVLSQSSGQLHTYKTWAKRLKFSAFPV